MARRNERIDDLLDGRGRQLLRVLDADLKAWKEAGGTWAWMNLYQYICWESDRMHLKRGPIRFIRPAGSTLPFPKGSK